MVDDVQTAQKQISQARTILATQKRQVSQARKQIKATPAKTQLLLQTRQQQVRRAPIKKAQLKEVSKIESSVSEFEKKITSAQKELDTVKKSREDFRLARQAADRAARGKPFVIESLKNEAQKDFFKQIVKAEQASSGRQKALKELGKGISTKELEAKIRSFRSDLKQQTLAPPEDLAQMSFATQEDLQQITFQRLEDISKQSFASPSDLLQQTIIRPEDLRRISFADPSDRIKEAKKIDEDVKRIIKASQIIQKKELRKITDIIVSPEFPIALAGELTNVVFKAGKKAEDITKTVLSRFGVSEKNIIFRKVSPEIGQASKEIVRDLFVFSAFSPFIKTATATKTSGKVKVKQTQIKQTDKEKIKKLIELRKELQKATASKTKAFIKKESSKILKSNLSPSQKASRLRNLELFVREAKGQIKFVDGKVVQVVDIGKKAVVKTVPKPTVGFVGPPVAQLEQLPKLLTGVTATQKLSPQEQEIKKIDEILRTQKISPLEIFNLKQKRDQLQNQVSSLGGTSQSTKNEIAQIKQSLTTEKLNPAQVFNLKAKLISLEQNQKAVEQLKSDSLSSQLQNSQSRQNQLSKQLQLSKQASLQDSLQQQKQKSLQQQLSKQLSLSKALQKQLSGLKTVSATKSASTPTSLLKAPQTKVPGKGIGKPPIQKPAKTKFPFITLDSDDVKKTIVGLKLRKVTAGWQPLIKSRGEFRVLSKPFRSKSQAENFARWVVDNSTSARYKLKIVPVTKKDFSMKNIVGPSQLKFRNFRRVKGEIIPLPDSGAIEKRAKRIDTKGEILQLKAAKAVAERFGKSGKLKLGGKVTLKAPK